MSHVIGQGTIASNHYRTSEYRASQYQTPQEFNSETLEFNASERQLLKNAVKQFDAVIVGLRKQLKNGDILTANIKKMLGDFDNKTLTKRFKNFFKNRAGPDDVVWLRKMLKGEKLGPEGSARLADSLLGVDADKFIKKSFKDSVAGAGDIVKNSDMSPFVKKMTTGSLVIVGGVAFIGTFMGLGGNEALQKWVDSTTGADCPEKADAKGLEEGTDEYAAAVGACQQGMIDSLMKLGYGALAIVGFVGLIAVTRAIPKRKAKKEEDSEDEE
jgi:hypothetical protein